MKIQLPFERDAFLKTIIRLLLVIILSIVVLSVVVLSCVPPVTRDALSHHLAVPKLYLKHGGIYMIPAIIFSFYPMNLELLYMVPLYFGNDIIPKYIHFSFALMTGWLIFYYLKKRINTYYALLGVLLFISIPVIFKLSITVYVDLGLIFFSTAAIIYLFKWIENRFKPKMLVISAIWCGLALGTKYNGLVVWILLTLFIPFIYSRLNCGGVSVALKSIGNGAIFMLVALLIFSPWMTRNFIWKKNPVYPLYQNLFHPKKGNAISIPLKSRESGVVSNSMGKKKISDSKLEHFAYRKIIYNESLWEIILVPLRIFFQGEDDNPKYFDGKLNPLLFILPFFAFRGRRKEPAVLKVEKGILLSFSILFLMIVFFKIEMRIRYIAPIIPSLVILSMFGLNGIVTMINDRCSESLRRFYMGFVFFMVICLLGINVVYIANQFGHVDPVSYLTGRISRDEYIEKYRREYPVLKYANRYLPEKAKILCIFLGNRIYYSDRETISSWKLFLKTVKGSDSPDKIFSGLKQRKISHLLIRHDLFNNWLNDNFNNKEKQNTLAFFEKHTGLLYHKNGYELFELLTPASI